MSGASDGFCSLFRPVIDTDKCNGCTLCSRNCKAACIDIKTHRIDYSRCVACMDCIGKCRQGAISYRMRVSQPASAGAAEGGVSRRGFLTVAGLFAAASVVRAQEKTVDGGLAAIADKKAPSRATPIVPPGARGLRHMFQHCTACQLCVSVCPNEVLRPSSEWKTMMQPVMSYERGYCRRECTKCSEVCPGGGIRHLPLGDK